MKTIALIAVTGFAAASNAAIDFNFEDQSIGALAGETVTLTSQGVDVTFSGPGLQIRNFGASFNNAQNVLSSLSDAGPIEVIFSQAVLEVSFENIINGRYTSEVDFIDGVAYDAANNIVDSFTGDISDRPTLSGAGIVRVVWAESNEFEGFVVDDVSFVVPAPGAVALLGLGGLVAARRRRA